MKSIILHAIEDIPHEKAPYFLPWSKVSERAVKNAVKPMLPTAEG